MLAQASRMLPRYLGVPGSVRQIIDQSQRNGPATRLVIAHGVR